MTTGITGKDVTIALSLDGAPQTIYDDVTSFERSPMIEETTSRVLGRDGAKVDTEWTGWEGTIEFEVSSAELDELLDAMTLAVQARTPYVITIGEVVKYRDLTSKSYTYIDCKIVGMPKRARSGEKASISLRWKSGSNRVAG